jgi:salicylate hydroxylase
VLEAGAREAGVRIETGRKVTRVDLSGATPGLGFADGPAARPGLLVGADGVRSLVRPALVGERQPEFTGHVAWRALVAAPGDGRWDVAAEAQVFMAPGRHVVAYPLRGGRLLNLVAVEERQDWVEEGWHHAGEPDEMRRRFAAFAEPLRGWLGRVETCMVWGLFRHPVAARWHGPGVALLGDAAHPTLPFLAQGACMALEDAHALARALSEHDTEAAALAGYEAGRVGRVRRIVDAATANARNYHLGGIERRAAHAALRVIDRVAPGVMLGRFDWLYGYDATA